MKKFGIRAVSIAVATLIAGCGGGGGANNSPADISGRVIDGYIKGATVFWDCNKNGIFDSGEESTTTGDDGIYKIKNKGEDGCQLLAYVPSNAVDKDRPFDVGRSAYTMRAVPGIYDLITPFTTIISGKMASDGISVDQANSALAGILGVNKNLLVDFIGNKDPELSAFAVDVRRVLEMAALNKIPAGSSIFDAIKLRYADSAFMASVARGVEVFDYSFTSAIDRVSKFYNGSPGNKLVRRVSFSDAQVNDNLDRIAGQVNSRGGALFGSADWSKFSDEEIKKIFLSINQANSVRPISSRSIDLQEIQKRRNFLFSAASSELNLTIENENDLSTFFTNNPGATWDWLLESLSISGELAVDLATVATAIPVKYIKPKSMGKLVEFVGENGAGTFFKEGSQLATSYAKCVTAIFRVQSAGGVEFADKIPGFVLDCGAFFFDNIKEISKIQKNNKISDVFNVATNVLDASGNVYLTLTEQDKLLIVYRYYITIFGLLHGVLDGVPDPVTEKVNAGINIGVQTLKAIVASIELEKAANEKRDEKYDAAFKLYNERASKIWRSYYISFLEIYDDYYFRVADASACTNGTELDLVGVCSPPVIASVSGVSPAVANLSQATTFTITGQNLPLTPTMTLGGIPCQIQSSPAPTASGFTAVCTPSGGAGSQVVKVSDASGVVIDQSKSVNVNVVPNTAATGWTVSTYVQYQYMQLAGITIDPDLNIYGTDIGYHRVYKISSDRQINLYFDLWSGYVNCGHIMNPYSVTLGVDGYLYVADTGYNIIDVLDAKNSKIKSYGYCRHGSGSPDVFRFNGPVGIVSARDGSIYVANAGTINTVENNYIAKISSNGSTSVLAGSNSPGFADGQGSAASFNFQGLSGMAVDSSGNIYVADSGNHRIRKVSPGGYVTTVAGSGVAGFQDGQALSAAFKNPSAVAVDSKGNIYVADAGNLKIRMISVGGVVTTIAGGGGVVNNEAIDGVGGAASFLALFGMAIDRNDNIYVTDAWLKDGGWYWGKIRKISYGVVN